jgi:BirA family biotin operon repressor/biotin-[acetyl-CoA-carboxylase] ligase
MTLFTGKYCIRLEKIRSTNSYLADLCAKENLPEGTVVITEKQEQGRGQRGTNWESEPGKNLTLSIFLKPTFLKPEEQFELSKAVSLGVLDFVGSLLPTSFSLLPKVKWPNDIYIGNKKIAGILIENSVIGNSLNQSIIGIGINVNQEKFSEDLPNPTSFKLEAGREFNLEDCLEKLCWRIEKRYLQLKNHIKEIDADYFKNLYRFNEWAGYNYKGEIISAKIVGISKIGKLILETENKNLECDFKELEFTLPSSSRPAD